MHFALGSELPALASGTQQLSQHSNFWKGPQERAYSNISRGGRTAEHRRQLQSTDWGTRMESKLRGSLGCLVLHSGWHEAGNQAAAAITKCQLENELCYSISGRPNVGAALSAQGSAQNVYWFLTTGVSTKLVRGLSILWIWSFLFLGWRIDVDLPRGLAT